MRTVMCYGSATVMNASFHGSVLTIWIFEVLTVNYRMSSWIQSLFSD